MRDPERIKEIIPLLQSAWEAAPDWRLGQLISNLAQMGGWKNNDVFYPEDEVFIMGLQRFHEEVLKQKAKESSDG